MNNNKKIFQIINFGNGKKISTLEAINIISEILKTRPNINLF
jgi:hypothetical protein